MWRCTRGLIRILDIHSVPQLFQAGYSPIVEITEDLSDQSTSESNTAMSSKSQLTYSARASNHPNALAKRLFQIAEAKKTNVTVSADVTTTRELLDLANRT